MKRDRLGGGLFYLRGVIFPEQQSDAPQAGNTDERIDDAADQGHLTAAEKRDAVKAEESYAAPVQSAYDGQYQSDAVYDLHIETSSKDSVHYLSSNKESYTKKL